MDGLALEEVPLLLLLVILFVEIPKLFYLSFVTMETQAVQTNAMDLVQEMCLAGIVQEAAQQLPLIVSLNAEMEFEQDLKHVMTAF